MTWKNLLRKLPSGETTWNFVKTFSAQAGVVFVLAAAIAIYRCIDQEDWTFRTFGAGFGMAIVPIGMMAGYMSRAWKQVGDLSRHGALVKQQDNLKREFNDRLDASIARIESSERAIVSRLDEAASKFEAAVKDIVDYTTGGNSWQRLVFAEIKGDLLSELTFLFEGKHPLYTVKLDVIDVMRFREIANQRFPRPEDGLVMRKTWETIAPGFAHSYSVNLELRRRQKNIFRLNWHARNGSWAQDLEIIWVNDKWAHAFTNEREGHKKELHAFEGFPTNPEGAPVFSNLDEVAPIEHRWDTAPPP